DGYVYRSHSYSRCADLLTLRSTRDAKLGVCYREVPPHPPNYEFPSVKGIESISRFPQFRSLVMDQVSTTYHGYWIYLEIASIIQVPLKRVPALHGHPTAPLLKKLNLTNKRIAAQYYHNSWGSLVFFFYRP
ncbi:unnamed protein product, partial [Tuber aestivum]